MAIPVSFAPEPSVLRPPIPNRVLVVDDEPLIRWSLCMALEAAGFDAVPASNGQEARRLATEWPPPRVAVIDLLGAQDTRELLDFVRRIYADCRFVLMTTSRQQSVRYQRHRLQVIEKPFDLNTVVAVIRNLLEDVPGGGSQST